MEWRYIDISGILGDSQSAVNLEWGTKLGDDSERVFSLKAVLSSLRSERLGLPLAFVIFGGEGWEGGCGVRLVIIGKAYFSLVPKKSKFALEQKKTSISDKLKSKHKETRVL